MLGHKSIRIFLISTLFLVFFFSNLITVWAHEQDSRSRQLDLLDLNEVDNFIHEMDQELNRFIPDFSLKEFIQNLKDGQISFQPQQFINGVWRFFIKEIGANYALMGKLILLSIICAVLGNLQSAFQGDNIGKLAHMVSFLVLITLAMGSFQLTMEIGQDTVNRMVSFMQILLPVLFILLTALGGFATTALLHPFLLIALALLGTFFKVIIFPLIYLEGILKIVNNIADNFKIDNFSQLFRDALKFCLGISFTLFTGVLGLQGIAGSVSDGITLRTAKYMSGVFIPVVGGMFADALDTVVGGALILKNAIGLLGLLVIVCLTLFPMLKILTIVIIYKLSAAMIQPIGDTRVADTLMGMSNSLLLVFGAVATVSLMFFLTILIIIVTANVTVMLR